MTPPRAWSGPGSPPTPPCTKRRWAGKKTGPNPTDRAKSGTKRHVLTDGGGVPIALVITAANTPDKTALAELLDARVVRPPAFTLQHLCLDKGYDYADADEAVWRRRFVAHIRRRGEERRRLRRWRCLCRRGRRRLGFGKPGLGRVQPLLDSNLQRPKTLQFAPHCLFVARALAGRFLRHRAR